MPSKGINGELRKLKTVKDKSVVYEKYCLFGLKTSLKMEIELLLVC